MEKTNLSTSTPEPPVPISNWPMSLETTRKALTQTQTRLSQYQAALRLANTEIEQRNQGILTLTKFIYHAGHSLTPFNVLQLALQRALQITTAPVGAIVLINAETKDLTLSVHKGLPTNLSNILTGQQLTKGAAVLMPHLVAGTGALLEQPAQDKAEQLLLTTNDLTSLVSLPISLNTKLIGSLLIGLQQETRSFNAAELHFLMILCQETALSLNNLQLRDDLWQTAEMLLTENTGSIELSDKNIAQLNVTTAINEPTAPTAVEPVEDDLEHLLVGMMEAEEELQQQNNDLQTLNTVSEIINRTLSLKEILQCAVEQTKSTLQTDAAWIYLKNNDVLEIQTQAGLSTDYVQEMQHLNLDESIEGQVVTQNKASFIEFMPDNPNEHNKEVDNEKLHALAVVPITRRVLDNDTHTPHLEVVGVLATGKRTEMPYTWTPRESRLLTSIANQLAVALENAHLYAQVHEKEAGLSSNNKTLRSINDMLLEKNAYLEGFIHDDLPQALNEISQVLQYFPESTLKAQTEKVNQLRDIVQHMGSQTKAANYISVTLDTTFDETLDDTVKQSTYTGAVKPTRLQKKEPEETKPYDSIPPSPPLLDNSKPMSFEDAVAAGLVPSHIVNKETTDE